MKRFAFLIAMIASVIFCGSASAQCTSGSCSASVSQHTGLFARLHAARHPVTVATTTATACTTMTVTTTVQAPKKGGKFSGLFLDAAKAELKRIVLSTGRLTEAGYDKLIANNTNAQGTVNWNNILAFLNGLLADAPEIIALVQQIIALFGGA